MIAGSMTTEAPNGFGDSFASLVPLIKDEWPAVDPTSLEQTGGEYDLVVALISDETTQSKALVQDKLAEMQTVASDDGDAAEEKRVRRVLNKIQERSNEIAGYVRKQMLEDAKTKVGQNPLVSLLMAIGLGFIFGFLLRGMGRRD